MNNTQDSSFSMQPNGSAHQRTRPATFQIRADIRALAANEELVLAGSSSSSLSQNVPRHLSSSSRGAAPPHPHDLSSNLKAVDQYDKSPAQSYRSSAEGSRSNTASPAAVGNNSNATVHNTSSSRNNNNSTSSCSNGKQMSVTKPPWRSQTINDTVPLASPINQTNVADPANAAEFSVGGGEEEGTEFVVETASDNKVLRWVTELPIVGESCARFVAAAERAVPPGGHLSNIFNMASNTLGIGIVSMASGFNTTGIGLAVILMIVCAVLVVFSFYLIGATCERSPYRSWESACRGILFRGADYCVAGVMIFFQFGTMVGFVTAAHDLVGPFISDVSSMTDATRTQQRVVTVLVWLCAMFPLCLPRRVASLRYFSIVGVTLVIYFVFAVVLHSIRAGLPHLHEMKIFASGIDAVNGLTLFIFAFLGHGLCFRLFDEMQRPSADNLLKDGCGSVSMIGVLYFIVGFFGYAEFGLDISGSIFKYYHVRNEPMMCVAYIGIMLKICVAYALSGQACRLPVYYVLQRDIDHSSYRLHLLITVPLCVGSLIMGMYVPDINIVFNLLGSICGGILAFLLPAFFVMYLGGWTLKRVGWFRLGMTYLNIIAGVVAIVFGTAVTIDGMVR